MTRRWLMERRKEYYYKKAKKENLRSRAAYKIKQLNDKYGVIKPGDFVLDLGSAPGGWLIAVRDIVGVNGLIVGVDIQPIREVHGCRFILGDITDDKTVESIKEVSGKFDVVTCDCSPNLSGNWELDHSRQIYLAEKALEICRKLLKDRGAFIVKVFQGEYFQEFIDKMRKGFGKVLITKPEASRKKSSEVYVIGKLFKRRSQ